MYKKRLSGVEVAIKSAGGQRQLAELLGISQQAVSKFNAQGFLPLPRAREVAHFYGIPLKTLIAPETLGVINEL